VTAAAAVPTPRVLLVDDTESVLLLYARQLRASGYEVLLAESGAAALVILERETPDLIVLDCMMPNMSGLEVLRKVRQMPLLADIPVIFLTAAGDEEELVNRAFEQGISDYIAKPVNRHVLVARINALIAERRSRSVEQRLDATSLASHKDLVEEVARAQSLQRAQLPQVPMRWSNWFVTGLLVPCSQVGGDLFDVVEGTSPQHQHTNMATFTHWYNAGVGISGDFLVRIKATDTPGSGMKRGSSRVFGSGSAVKAIRPLPWAAMSMLSMPVLVTSPTKRIGLPAPSPLVSPLKTASESVVR